MSEIHYNTQGSIARLFSQLKGQQVRLTIVAISIIIYIGLSIWNPMYSTIVIDHLWQSIQAAWQNGTPFSITWDNMGRELFQLSVQYFCTWIFYYLQSYLMANVAETLTLRLRKQISRKLNRLPLRFFDQNKAGEILSRVTSDLDKIAEVLQTGLLKLLVAIGTVIGSLIIMFYYSLPLTLIFLVFMVISMVITQIVSNKNLQYATERQETIKPSPTSPVSWRNIIMEEMSSRHSTTSRKAWSRSPLRLNGTASPARRRTFWSTASTR